MDYTEIKEMAAERGIKINDLLALAPKNDPFYVGTPATLTRGHWFAEIFNRAGFSPARPAHLRRVHYWITTNRIPTKLPDGTVYENTEGHWNYIVEAGKAARYLGLVPLEGVVDAKNPHPEVSAIYSLGGDPNFEINVPELEEPYIWVNGLTVANAQPYHLEIWVEKSTMNDVLLPFAKRYSANLVWFQGECSITSVCVDLMNRIEESEYKPTRIFYISDFDPAGNSMPVAMSRKLEYAIDQFGDSLDVRVKPLALSPKQVEDYQLPRIPLKEKERRAGKFQDSFGVGGVELDALEALYPGELVKLLGAEFANYYSEEAAHEVREAERKIKEAVQEKIKSITDEYQEEIGALSEMVKRLKQVESEVDASEFAVERYEPEAYEDDQDWLFDSQRPYMEQINYYKAHKGLDAVEE